MKKMYLLFKNDTTALSSLGHGLLSVIIVHLLIGFQSNMTPYQLQRISNLFFDIKSGTL